MDQALPKHDGENPNPHLYPSATSKSRGMASEDKIVPKWTPRRYIPQYPGDKMRLIDQFLYTTTTTMPYPTRWGRLHGSTSAIMLLTNFYISKVKQIKVLANKIIALESNL